MNKIDWKQKLSSRKFWAAIAGIVTAILIILNTDELTIERTAALISAEGTLIAYILTEGSIDESSVKENENEH
ncbi:MAG TPA: hypothetical protein PKI60_01970 [Oscillospiraceae bacterium]|nr:hypothetical protein [Oscillospiraceae bacterium]